MWSPPAAPANEADRLAVLATCGLMDTPPDERFDRLTRLARRLYGADVAFLGLIDATHQWQKSRTSDLVPASVPRRDTFCSVMVTSGEPLVIGDMRCDPRFAGHPAVADLPLRFYAGAPLMVAPELVIGSLCVMGREARDPEAFDFGPLLDLAAVAADEVELLRLNLDLARKSQVDVLTGLLNRRSFDEAMERAVRRAQRIAGPLSLLVIDIDHFKVVNDLWGHQAGDAVLAAIGGVLSRLPGRAQDTAARYGGEEFAVILPDTDETGCDVVGAALLAALRAENIPHPSGGRVTASIGGATARGEKLADLFAAADAALYAAKDGGRDLYCRSVVG